MLKIITSAQMKEADAFTIRDQSISSYDLMEKASAAFVKIFIHENPDTALKIAVFCGMGNNGGDGLAIARLLYNRGYLNITVFTIKFSSAQTEDNLKNEKALTSTGVKVTVLKNADSFANVEADVCIDAIFGSGLNKSLSGEYLQLITKINNLSKKTYAVDIPSGMLADGEFAEEYNGIKAYKTISFQRAKLNFFFPESLVATKFYEVANIDLSEEYIQSLPSDYFQIEDKDVKNILQPRSRFSHKGNYGHVLVVSGSTRTMGAALLNCMGVVFSGAGLVSACIPESGLATLNTTIPEAMYVPRDEINTEGFIQKFTAVAAGSGLGINAEAGKIIEQVISAGRSLVLDADALNMLAKNNELLHLLPEHTVLTPHVKEFDRLFGMHKSWWARMKTARNEALSRKIIIVLKNQYTFICSYDGKVYINSTGNPAMAQGGMGDVLTGIIASFRAQGYDPIASCILACYIHGKAGDTLAKNKIVVTASELAKQIAIEMKHAISTN